MKRHPSLEPFSRDHNVALFLGRKATKAPQIAELERMEVQSDILRYWSDELEDHFGEEERLLGPLAPTDELRQRLLSDHSAFRACITEFRLGPASVETLVRAGELLGTHTRWEENEFFPSIESSCTEGQLAKLGEETTELEDRRAKSNWSPKRGELMARRNAQKNEP